MYPLPLVSRVVLRLLSFALLVTITVFEPQVKAQTQQALFPLPNQINSVAGTLVFTGDFNGDGKPDLAYTSPALGNSSDPYGLGIVLSVGSNTGTPVITPLCPGGPPYVNFADVNGDKKLDLVFSCNGYETVQFGNGDGTFQTPAYYALNAGTTPVLTDLNGDGYPDIAVLFYSGNPAVTQIAVLLNQGASAPGVFASPKVYALPSGAGNLEAGDFNGDGKQDLVTTVNTGVSYPQLTALSVFYGNGDGTLKAANTQSTSAFSSLTMGDFNGDGATDLALLQISNNLYTSVQILLGSTSGVFGQGSAFPIASTIGTNLGYTGPMVAVSLTANGNLDLVVNTGILNTFLGDGKGNFAPAGSYALSGDSIFFADTNADGKQDLILGTADQGFIFSGNGDGTFQASPGSAFYGPTADVNNDGLADIVFTPPLGGAFFGAALGRGDGTFAPLDQTTSLPAPFVDGFFLTLGDFNGDGKVDTVAVQPGSGPDIPCGTQANAELVSYLGTGTGQFQPAGSAVALGVGNAQLGVTGDFNSDGKLDLIIGFGPYTSSCQAGLLFLPGNGDGTFGTPVNLNVTQGNTNPGLLVADLNNDKKPDLVWGNAVLLGNGDGTFKQIPLNIPSASGGSVAAVAIADLNGDGIPDAVAAPGTAIYAGNGDGTFQTTPFYTVPIPCNGLACASATFVAIANVNGDNNPDLLLAVGTGLNGALVVYLGDGHGNFTQDPNNYVIVPQSAALNGNAATPARLNNQAPALPNDWKQDLLFTLASSSADAGSYSVSLLNQTNLSPTKPPPFTSMTTVQASPATAGAGAPIALTASVLGTNPTGSVTFFANGNSLGRETVVNGTATLATSFANAGNYSVTATYAGDDNNSGSTSPAVTVTITAAASTTTLQAPGAGNVNGQITLKATVTGDSPTGSVSFTAGSTKLGTATLTNGVATLQYAFAAAGSYSVTATYGGDQNNSGSTSNAVTIVIAAPGFTVSATPTSGTVPSGQTATFTFTLTPTGGYAGTVKFSCGTLPADAACNFSPASLAPSDGSAVTSTLTIATSSATAMLHRDRQSGSSLPPWIPAGGLAAAGFLGLALTPKRVRRWNREFRVLSWVLLLLSASVATFGCGGGSSSPSGPANTPAGTYTISVTAADNSGGPQQAVTVSLTVQ
jgi:hypothetical protein